MLTHPGFQLVPHVLPAVAEKHQPLGIEAEPVTLYLSNYHLRSPLGNKWDIRGGLDHGNLDAFSGLADTIAGAA
jgi:hypothetical protein